MYDSKQEPREFVGDNREAAVAKAQTFFGAEKEQLQIQEFRSGEVYGLGGRTLVVAVPRTRKPAGRSERERPERERPERERPGREKRERGGRSGGQATRERGGGKVREEAAAERAPTVATVEGELGEVGAFVRGVVERLDVGPFAIAESVEGDLTVIQLKGGAAEALGSGEARAVDALQLLANQVAVRLDEQGRRVVLDVEGGSESRERHLERLAERVVRRAKESGRSVALDPMNGRDRRVIHLAVRSEDGVATMSMGEGRYRQVVIVPEGAEEYEEAVRASEAADTSE